MSEIPHISWSQIRNWNKCPLYHKKVSIDEEIDYPTNEHTVIGRAVHSVCEMILDSMIIELPESVLLGSIRIGLKQAIMGELEECSEELDFEFIDEYREKVEPILISLRKRVNYELDSPKVLDIEKYITYIEDEFEHFPREAKIRGHVDAIFSSRDTIFLVDWKTSNKGWGRYKLNDPMTLGQLQLYRRMLDKKGIFDYDDMQPLYVVFNKKEQSTEFHYVDDYDVSSDELLKNMDKMLYNAFERELYMPSKSKCEPFCDCKENGLL